MSLQRYKTNYRLWLSASLILFLVACLLGVWRGIAIAAFLFSEGRYEEGLPLIIELLKYIGLPALLCGWVFQSIVVMVVRGRNRRLKRNAQQYRSTGTAAARFDFGRSG